MDTITKEISDVVCTAITLGHIVQFKHTNNKNIQIVCESEDDEKAHNTLKDTLSTYGCNIDVCKIMPKERKELLITVKDRTYTSESLKIYTEDINRILQKYNQMINKEKGSAILYGAYIGGKYNVVYNVLQLLCPSQLIIKPKNYELDGITYNQLQTKYDENIKTINDIISALNSVKEKDITLKSVKEKDITLKLDEIKIVDNEAKITDKDIFGSVHGLINAIIHYNIYNSTDKDSIACELACSDDTTKVGSCVPCSIFASSNKTPANYTHFGRGDYWNLPQKSEGYNALGMKRGEWETYVIECFKTGIDIVNKMPGANKANIKKAIDAVYNYKTGNIGNIPELFLHSLMFEGKFIEKINRVI